MQVHDILSARPGSPAIIVSKYSTSEEVDSEYPKQRYSWNTSLAGINNIRSGNTYRKHSDLGCAGVEHEHDNEDEDEHCGQEPDGQQRSDYGDLGTLIRKCGIRHADKGNKNIQQFWPLKLLRRILTLDRVIEELEAYGARGYKYNSPTVDLAAQILLQHVKIFAILILVDKVTDIENVMREGLTDSDLPLEAHGIISNLHRSGTGNRASRLIGCFSGPLWKTHERETFSLAQHKVDPRTMEPEGDGSTPKHKDFMHEAVLPFMRVEQRGGRPPEIEYGGYGKVTVVQIHPDCHGFHEILEPVRYVDRPLYGPSY